MGGVSTKGYLGYSSRENNVLLSNFISDANSPFNSSYIPGSRSHVVFERVIGYPKPDYAGKLCRRTINSYSKIVCGCVQLNV